MVLDFGMSGLGFQTSKWSGEGFDAYRSTQGYVDSTQPASPPVGSVIAWLKNFAYNPVDSGTTTSTQATKLVDNTQNFITTIRIGFTVVNTTTGASTIVTAIDSNIQLSLENDIMVNGDAYIIYQSIALNDQWIECNGQVISDAESLYNGETAPNLNGNGVTARFLRGALASGTTGGSSTTSGPSATVLCDDSQLQADKYPGSSTHTHTFTPEYYSVVWIMRIK